MFLKIFILIYITHETQINPKYFCGRGGAKTGYNYKIFNDYNHQKAVGFSQGLHEHIHTCTYTQTHILHLEPLKIRSLEEQMADTTGKLKKQGVSSLMGLRIYRASLKKALKECGILNQKIWTST